MKLALETNQLSFNQKLITILLTGIAIWSIWYLHEVILLAFLAIVIAIGISLPISKLQRLGMSRLYATTISVILAAIFFTILILWLAPLFAREVESFVNQVPRMLESLQRQYAGTGFGDIIDSLIGVTPSGDFGMAVGEGPSLWDRFVDKGLPIVFSGAGVLISVVANLLLVLVVSIMLLINPKSYINALLYVVPRSTHQPIITIANKIYETIKAWLKSLSFSILFTSITVFVGMSLVGVPNPAAIALFAALATFVPNIGSIIPLLPIALFTIPISAELFVIAAIVYLGIQLIESNVVTPMVVKHQLNIPVAAVLVFQIIAGVLFGLLGVLLAVPLLATIITIVRELVAKAHYGYEPNEIVVTADERNHLHLTRK